MLLTCTVDELQEFLKPNDPNGFDVYEKTQFSMLDPKHVNKYPAKTGVSVIFGIEAHICVQQTVLDLLDEGENVYVVADAVSSQRSYDRGIALAVRKASFIHHVHEHPLHMRQDPQTCAPQRLEHKRVEL